MSPNYEELKAGLEAVLAAAGYRDLTVRVAGDASVGATRRTVFIDVNTDTNSIPAVAQVSSRASQLALPMTASDEAGLVNMAEDAGVPVASMLAASDDESLVGGPVVIARRVDGLTVPRHVLRSLAEIAGAGDALAAQCGAALARLHGVDLELVPESVPRMAEPTPAESYVAELHRLLDNLNHPHPVLRLGVNWLGRNLPDAPTHPSLVHGDFRNGNLVITPQGLGAVLDWELAHIGDPMEDLAYLCMRTWRFGQNDNVVGGFGSLEALQAAYEAEGGLWRQQAFAWWMTARTVWWGIGLAFQAWNFAEGRSSSIVHAASGRRVVELEYDLLNLIDEQGGL